MKIWKLSPIDLNHRDWDRSEFRKEIIVRAESEDKARKFAKIKLNIAACKDTASKGQENPWTNPVLVSVVEVTDESYSNTGKEEILYPEEACAYN